MRYDKNEGDTAFQCEVYHRLNRLESDLNFVRAAHVATVLVSMALIVFIVFSGV